MAFKSDAVITLSVISDESMAIPSVVWSAPPEMVIPVPVKSVIASVLTVIVPAVIAFDVEDSVSAVAVVAPRPVTVAKVSASVAVSVTLPPSETDAPPVNIPAEFIVMEEFVSDALAMFESVLDAPDMVLLVKVWD